jgi:hypothetical protein
MRSVELSVQVQRSRLVGVVRRVLRASVALGIGWIIHLDGW